MTEINKVFQIKCPRCAWSEFSSGLKQDIKHLFEVKKCATCGGPRKFRCPKCGQLANMKRLVGNNKVGQEPNAAGTNPGEKTT